MRRQPSKGLALVLVMGIMTLLSLLATALLAISSRLKIQAGLQEDQVTARLLSRSGIEYAGARIKADSSPKNPPTRDNQPDDWTYRDDPSVPLEQARNPSYSQGEPYTEAGIPNGRFDAGTESFTDANGNNRFDSWSGRLRSRYGMGEDTFVLRIPGEGTQGINVNSGLMTKTDINGNGTWDYQDLGAKVQLSVGGKLGPPVSVGLQWQPGEHHARNRRLAAAIDNLAFFLGVAIPFPGEKIVLNRPFGGYPNLDTVQGLCRFSPSDWDRLRPHLGVFGHKNSCGLYWVNECAVEDDQYLVSARTAAPELLAALFSGMAMHSDAAHVYPMILPTEALQVGRFLKEYAFRYKSWYDLYLEFQANRDKLFVWSPQPVDTLLDLLGSNPLGSLFKPQGLTVDLGDTRPVKASLVHTLASPEDLGDYRAQPFQGWMTYDEPGARIMKSLSDYVAPPNSNSAWPSFKGSAAGLEFTPNLSLFSIQSLGRAGVGGKRTILSTLDGSSAILVLGGKIDARSQADFENLRFTLDTDGFPGNFLPEKCFEGGAMIGRPAKDRATTYPCFSRDACRGILRDLAKDPLLRRSLWPQGGPTPALQSDRLLDFGYCFHFGEVMLMDRSWADPNPDLAFYLPNWDLDQPERPTPGPDFAFDRNFDDAAQGAVWNRQDSPGRPDAAFRTTKSDLDAEDLLLLRCQVLGTGTKDGWGGLSMATPTPYDTLLQFIWNVSGGSDMNTGYCPLVDDSGAVTQGATEQWCLSVNNMWRAIVVMKKKVFGSVLVDELHYIMVQTCRDWQAGFSTSGTEYSSANWYDPSPPVGQDEIHVSVAYGSSGVQGYVNGIFHGGDDSFEPFAPDLSGDQRLQFYHRLSGVAFDEMRLYRQPLPAEAVAVHALKGRYWTSDATPTPSFTSPLYRFDSPVKLTDVSWDGFVPKALKAAADDWNRDNPDDPKAPIRVALIVEAGGSEVTVPLPADSWRTGGIQADFKALWQAIRPGASPPAVDALHYRVWMDASALNLAWQTPVFDGISIGFDSARPRWRSAR